MGFVSNEDHNPYLVAQWRVGDSKLKDAGSIPGQPRPLLLANTARIFFARNSGRLSEGCIRGITFTCKGCPLSFPVCSSVVSFSSLQSWTSLEFEPFPSKTSFTNESQVSSLHYVYPHKRAPCFRCSCFRDLQLVQL